jgi:hypothetical protein
LFDNQKTKFDLTLMSLEKLASDYVILNKNEEAINELQRLGIKLPSSLSRLLHVIDNRKTFKQCVTDPRLMGATDTDESLRSLIRLGFVNAVPADTATRAAAEPALTATTRLKVVTAVADPLNATQSNPVVAATAAAATPPASLSASMRTTGSMPVIRLGGDKAADKPADTNAARSQWEAEVDARHLETVKGTLVQDLRQILGKDVLLVQGKILSANNGEQLIRAVTTCSRVLEAAVSKEASQKLMDAFRRHFS